MIGNDAQHGIGAGIGARGHAEHAGGVLDDGVDQVGIVVGDLSLQDGGDAFEAHAGIDRGTRQGVQFARGVAIVLHEDEVPDFDKASAGIIGELLVFAAGFGGFDAEIVMNFGARAAGAGFAHLPEVVLLIEAEDAAFGNAGDFLPKHLGFIIFAEDGDVELVFGETVVLGDQLPRDTRSPRP